MKKQHEMFLVGMTAAVLLPALASADVCGSGLALPANIWTMFSAPCIPPTNAPTVNDQFNSDLGAGAAYGTTWVMYKWNSSAGQYVKLAATDNLEQGTGYWIYSTQAGTLKIDPGAHTTANTILAGADGYYGDCGQFGWSGTPCYKIDLEVPATAGETKWNMVGFPFVRSADWAEVHVAAYDGSTWTDAGAPTDADNGGYINKNGYVYKADGSGYDVFDDTASSPTDNTLQPNKSYWFQSKNASGTTPAAIALLIPAPRYTVFVTSQSWTGNLGGLSGADAKCQQAANNRSIIGDFRAWLSDSTTSASERFTHSGPYVRLDGGIFASDWSTLIDGTSTLYFNLTETGSYLIATDMTWTATNSDGSYLGPDCAGWTNAGVALLGREGSVNDFGVGWTTLDTSVCSVSNRLYCFEQEN